MRIRYFSVSSTEPAEGAYWIHFFSIIIGTCCYKIAGAGVSSTTSTFHKNFVTALVRKYTCSITFFLSHSQRLSHHFSCHKSWHTPSTLSILTPLRTAPAARAVRAAPMATERNRKKSFSCLKSVCADLTMEFNPLWPLFFSVIFSIWYKLPFAYSTHSNAWRGDLNLSKQIIPHVRCEVNCTNARACLTSEQSLINWDCSSCLVSFFICCS